MKNNPISLSFQITAVIILTTVMATLLVGYISMNKINLGFDEFLVGQRQMGEANKGMRHMQLEKEFKSTVINSLLISAGISVLFSILIGFLVSRKITKPLAHLKQQMKNVSKNNYEALEKKGGSKEVQHLIDEFNNLIAELNRIESLREKLVADVTHELKTPLTKIVGQLEGISDGLYKPSPARIKKILTNTKQLDYLISRLQELSEIQSGKVALEKETVFLHELIAEIVSDYNMSDEIDEFKGDKSDNKSINKSKSTTVVSSIPKHIEINADSPKLKQIIENLIENSLRYTHDGTITVVADEDGFSVVDTGVGISSEHLPYVFERFYRADQSRSKDTGGLGLGLAITKELVEAHDWDIDVVSEVDKGTTFTVSF